MGYDSLDKILQGVKDGTIITIGARPAMGKSIFTKNILLNLLEKYNEPTLYISLEANKERILNDFLSLTLEKTYQKIEEDENLKNQGFKKLQNKNYSLYISDNCYTIQELEQLLEEREFKFIVIDYIQLLKNEKEWNSKTDSFNECLDRLRKIVNKHKVILFLITQISRSVERRGEKEPLLFDLSSSGNLEYISDSVLFLYRENYYDRKIKNNRMEIIVAKNKNGPCGIIFLEYDEQRNKFIDCNN